jgi:hypothetical protein
MELVFFMRNLLQIYALLVCLFTIVIVIVSTWWSLYSTFEIVLPQYMHYSDLSKYDDDSFKADNSELVKNKNEEEIVQAKIKAMNKEIKNIKSSGVETLIKSILWLIVAVPFFIIHWNIHKRTSG